MLQLPYRLQTRNALEGCHQLTTDLPLRHYSMTSNQTEGQRRLSQLLHDHTKDQISQRPKERDYLAKVGRRTAIRQKATIRSISGEPAIRSCVSNCGKQGVKQATVAAVVDG